MLDSIIIKEKAKFFGANLCKIATVDRFTDSPVGFHPKDVLPETKSIISIACRVPEATLDAKSLIPYFANEEYATSKIRRITFELSLFIEEAGCKAVVVPSYPYEYWDVDNMEGKGIISLKHIAFLSGMGYIGKNSLVCSPEYGNLIKLGAILTDADLVPDDLLKGDMCGQDCNLCEISCPVRAISNYSVSQMKCRPASEVKNKRGSDIYTCNICRKVCPNRNGIKS